MQKIKAILVVFSSLGLIAGAGFVFAPAAHSQSALKRGRVQFEPCNLPNVKDAMCGKYEVWEDRAAKAGRKIALGIILLPALSEKPAPDAVFYFEGGPGGSATRKVKTQGDFVTALRRERDIVFIDQRGTGESNPLGCNLYGDTQAMSGYFSEALSVEKVRECRGQLERKANLALYTSSIAIDDFDEVRAALGYERINLFGGSYGSRAALVFMRQHPDRVRAAIIEGIAATDYKIPLPFAKGVQHALTRLFDDCRADQQCGEAFPGLRVEFESVLEKLDRGPVTFQAANPYTRQAEQITMSRNMFMDHMRMILYAPTTARLLPALIHQMAQGNYSTFASVSYQIYKGIGDLISRGMQLSVICAEDIPLITEDEIKRETAGTYYGESRARVYISACQQWVKGQLPARFSEPVKSNLPVLIISGGFDPVTPPGAGAEAAKYLPNSLHVIVHNTGHSFGSECLERLRTEFISKGSVKGLDPSCASDIKRPPFLLRLPASAVR
jgi:pimeloyl-ACP methyl ester carboxylesterase